MRVNVWELQLPPTATWSDVADVPDVATLGFGPLPDTGAVAGPGGRHAVSFEAVFPGVWGVTCTAGPDTEAAAAIGLVTAVAVTEPVTASAALTFTGAACRWDGPAALEVGDVVHVAIHNQSDTPIDVSGGMVVAGTTTEDLRAGLIETVTRVRMLVNGIAPDTEAEGFLHIDRAGDWAAECAVQDGQVRHPAFIRTVEA